MTTRLAARLTGPALAILFAAVSLAHSNVAVHDIVRFGVYVALGLVLPGMLMWRMLISGGGRTLLEDVACGTSLAFATELAFYLACAHLNHPGYARLWPVFPIALSLLPRFRAVAWRRPGEVAPAWYSWVLSGVVVYAITAVTRICWDVYPLTGRALRTPYVDTTYHLSLIGALSRHVPVDIPAVAGEPLYYHWFVHADLAAARHATGIEPLILLTRLGPLAMMVVAILGVAALARRVTGSYAGSALGAGLLVCAGGAALSWNFGNLFVSTYIFLSPTTIFAMALLIAVVAVSFVLLRREPAGPSGQVGPWIIAVLTLGAISGAKGSLLPVVLAGYLSAVLLGLIAERRLHRAATALLVIGAVWFEVAQKVIYGGSAQGTSLKPFGIGERVAVKLGLAQVGHVSLWLAAAATLVYLVSRLTLWSGAIGLFTRDMWRDPGARFVVGGGLAAAGAVAAFDNASYNQVYFLLVAPPLIAVSSAWGFVTLARRVPAEAARRVVPIAVGIGLTVGYLTKELYGDSRRNQFTVARLLLPTALGLTACVLAGLVVAVIIGGHHRRLVTVLAATTAVAALGLPLTLANAGDIATSPHDQFRSTAKSRFPIIGIGGIKAARWLRSHSAPGDVVATNVHCEHPNRPLCDHRSTWIAAYTERQMLLEGWAYSSRSGAEAEKQGVSVAYVAFWKPATLAENDILFTDPTAAHAARLRDHYGVRWLFVDKRFRAGIAGLRLVAKKRYRVGQYVVFRLL